MKASRAICRMWASITLCIAIVAIASHAVAVQVTLAWDPNTEPITAGYKIHYGIESQSFSVHIDVAKATSYTVTGLTAGQTYYFAATAYDASGNESAYSNVVSSTTAPASLNVAPTAPALPAGPSSLPVNTAGAFSTSASDPNGDSLKYRYDWGGGVISGWGAAGQSRSWAASGAYLVKAQAQDPSGLVSAWSSARSVTVTQAPAVIDSDGDGVPNTLDAFPNNPKEWADANKNGIGDNADAAASPVAPKLVAPVNNATSGVMAILKTDAFSTPAAGATHAKTRWQVFREEDDLCVLDTLSTTALLSLTVPKLLLDEGTAYYWRAQFTDSLNRGSAWSGYGHFATLATNSDRNANGIPDAQEVSMGTDLDGDGVKDAREGSIKSFKVAGASAQVGVSIKGSPTAVAIEAVESESAYTASSTPAQMPFGRIDFKIAVAQPGDPATVRLYFSRAATTGSSYSRYDSVGGKWYDYSANAAFTADFKSVALTLTDGGAGDADGVANGVIVAAGAVLAH
jgi:chitinase